MKIKTLIIAEAGVNHNGNLKTAYKLIDQAKYSGADFVQKQPLYLDIKEMENLKINSIC